jgi:signal transduction histidine kinase
VGLGLALVKSIAQRHGGRAFCENRPGGGACFVIELPLTSPLAA